MVYLNINDNSLDIYIFNKVNVCCIVKDKIVNCNCIIFEGKI